MHKNKAKWLSQKRRQKIWLWNGTKNNNTSSHMLLDHCYAFGCCCSLTPSPPPTPHPHPRDLFYPRPGSAPGRIWPKNDNTCKGPWVLHPYQVSSKFIEWFWRTKNNVKSLRMTDKWTDRQRMDGQNAMTIAHSSLQLRWDVIIFIHGDKITPQNAFHCFTVFFFH